jgi:hypothetical protein
LPSLARAMQISRRSRTSTSKPEDWVSLRNGPPMKAPGSKCDRAERYRMAWLESPWLSCSAANSTRILAVSS